MSKTNIFVEGKTDEEFVRALIEVHFDKKPDFVIYQLNGNHTRISSKVDRIKEGIMNLFILDSDVNSKEDVVAILNPIVEEEKAHERNVSFEVFLIENNLEHLVRKVVPESKNGLWSCIDEYSKCNEELKSNALQKIDSKTKVYIYVNAHDVPENFKKRAFQNPEIWNLEHEALNLLVEFLKKYLQ